MATILLILAFFFAIWFTTVNIMLCIHSQSISGWNFVIMSASITAIITHFIGIW